MFLPLLIPALAAIGLSILILRIVIGYLLRPIGPRRSLFHFPKINPRWIGRQLAILMEKFRR